MKPDALLLAGLLGMLALAFGGAAGLGRWVPRVAKLAAALSLVATAALWMLLATEEPDGPGGGLGVLIATVLSLLFLTVGVGLISGATSNLGIGVGLLTGLLLSALSGLWLFTSAPPLALAGLLVASCVGGYAWSRRSALGASAGSQVPRHLPGLLPRHLARRSAEPLRSSGAPLKRPD